MAKLSASQLVARLATVFTQKHLRCAVAESCTGGLIAAEITAYPGTSQWFDCGLVTYSNAAKHQFLGVTLETLQRFGAVSEETVKSMAEGILQRSQVHLSLAVTGIAGPGGGSVEEPVGTVWFAWASQGHPTRAELHHLNGTRSTIRNTCVTIALAGLLEQASKI